MTDAQITKLSDPRLWKDFGKYHTRSWSLDELKEKALIFNETPLNQSDARLQLLRPFFSATICPFVHVNEFGSVKTINTLTWEGTLFKLETMEWNQEISDRVFHKIKGDPPPRPIKPKEHDLTIELEDADNIVVRQKARGYGIRSFLYRKEIGRIPVANISSIEILPKEEKFQLIIHHS